MTIPNEPEIRTALAQLEDRTADELESQFLDFKPWTDPKACMKEAVEYAVCFANAEGGVVVFGVSDRVRGRRKSIHGAKGYNLDVWRRGLFDSLRPNLAVTVEELDVYEGTGKLLVVRIPKGPTPPYGTADGLYKRRVGKNCMPMDPASVARARIATGVVDWSGESAEAATLRDLDRLEFERARRVLHAANPTSELLKLDDERFLQGLGALRGGRVTNAGLLFFGKEEILSERCPQHQVHYVHQVSDTEIARNDSYRYPLIRTLERIEEAFGGPTNPEQEITLGLYKLRIPAYPIEVVREALLNAVTHRDYSDPGEVLVRHGPRELVVSSPGGFVAGITPKNILRHEPVSRNRTLAEAFEKLRLVERAGVGLRRIFVPLLSYGKRAPEYETDGTRVVLRIFDGSIDERMARLVAKWRQEGRDVDLDGLLVLAYLRDQAFIDSFAAAELLQLPREAARGVLDRLAQPLVGVLDRRGRTRATTYHLTKGLAKDLLGKAAYTKTRGLNPIRYSEMLRAFIADNGSITPQECRELLGLGESQSARVEVSRYLRRWSEGSAAFLRREGQGPRTRYYPKDK